MTQDTRTDPLRLRRTAQRTCSRCSRTPEEVDFKRDKRAPDGLGGYCKPCEKQYNADHYAANKARRNAQTNAHYHANRDRFLAQQKLYRSDNLGAIRAKERDRSRGNPVKIERSRRWRQENRQRFLDAMRRWYQNNIDRHRELNRQWCAANPERVREIAANSAAKRSARKRNAAGRIEHINRRAVWKRDRGICGLCAEPVPFRNMHLDHFIPLDKGGPHTWSNVHTTHSRCNLSKGNREVPKWGFVRITVPAPRKPLPQGALTLF